MRRTLGKWDPSEAVKQGLSPQRPPAGSASRPWCTRCWLPHSRTAASSPASHSETLQSSAKGARIILQARKQQILCARGKGTCQEAGSSAETISEPLGAGVGQRDGDESRTEEPMPPSSREM